ncbi:MAG: 16S rRNA methyltransferase [Anaerolineae bacterium]|nr:16S rRNA methyltransferase [Anaerolineae bacterium]
MADLEAPLDVLVDAIRSSARYGSITPELVRKLGAEELGKRPKLRDAVKSTKNRLHQVAGAYLSAPPPYESWLARLEAAPLDARREGCRALMQTHASTRERLPILDDFYVTTLASIAPVRSVLDVACGLNPLAIPFMPLTDDAQYFACDIYTDLADFLNRAFPLLGVTGEAWASDVTQTVPPQPVDLALVVKAIPCLQQIDKSIGARLLDGLQAKHLLVSYPVHSLGGASKGMRANYDAQFRELVAGRGWSVERFDFSTELAFLVTKEVP